MTVKELIDVLERLDPNLHVFTRGYEGGFEDVEFIKDPFDVALDVNDRWYYGKHEAVSKLADPTKYTNYKIVKGILL